MHPSDKSLPLLTIAEASRLIRERKLSPVELTQSLLSRIKSIDPQVNAFITVTQEQALAEAAKAESEIARGQWKGPLHGIPVAIKDIIDTAGTLTTCHSALFAQRIPESDATVVRLLKEAGAVSMGKTATWEFAVGGTSNDLPWPPARNPWNLAHDPGGSSSGSAAAVAAGLCLGALGTDTGGSIRGPSAWSGIAGFKPTYGMVSRSGVFPLSSSQDHVGPMCWTAEDCALMMDVLAKPDPLDPSCAAPGSTDFLQGLNAPLSGLRVGVVRHFFESDSPAEDAVHEAFAEALQVFSDAGCSIRDVSLSPLQHYLELSTLVERAEAFAVHQADISAQPEKYGALGLCRIGSGGLITSSDYINALRLRRRFIRDANAIMQSVDILLIPTRGTVAPQLAGFDMVNSSRIYTRPFNFLGFPGLSVCAGFSQDALPIGLQIVARPFEDALALRAGHFFESRTAHRALRPMA